VDAFPHVGKKTEITVKGKKVFPVVTGTFGMTDFLHSLVGELGDKVSQSEVEDMDSKLTKASENDDQNDQTSVLKEILDKVPWDMLEGDDKPDPSKADELKKASAAKTEESKQHPVDPNATLGGVNIEEAKQMAQQTLKDIYPILEFHDQILKAVTKIISKVPGLDELLENMSGALQIFAFSILAPYIKPIIAQARVELKSTSEGVLKSSEKGQYEVFENENSSDPTHSMLSKDHFSNVLNPVAGQVACATVRFVVPHIVESWSDNGKDVRQVIDDILQVFHHPALRDEHKQGQKAMFETVKSWWEGKNNSEKQHLKDILSHDGVKDGKNHEGEGAEGGHGHSHGSPAKKKEDDTIVPTAQEGASVISGLVDGLTSIVLEKTGLSSKLSGGEQGQEQKITSDNSSQGRGDQAPQKPVETRSHNRGDQAHQQPTENRPYGRDEGNSYGQEIGNRSHGRGEESSYGQEAENRPHGRGEESAYGQETENRSSYGRGNDSEGRPHGRENTHHESSYGQNPDRYGESRNDDNLESHRRGGNSYGENSTDRSSYGRAENSYVRDNNQQGSYTSGGNSYGESNRDESDGRRENSGFGDRQESGDADRYGRRE
jgi:hypothetical protein